MELKKYELKSTEIITEDGQVSKGPNMYANINFFVCHGMCKYIISAGSRIWTLIQTLGPSGPGLNSPPLNLFSYLALPISYNFLITFYPLCANYCSAICFSKF